MVDITSRAPSVALATRARIQFRTRLEDVRFGILLAMNPRSLHWRYTLYSEGGALLIDGFVITANSDLFAPVRSSGLVPAGQLFAFDTSREDGAPMRLGIWRERWQLRYRPVAEIGLNDPVVV